MIERHKIIGEVYLFLFRDNDILLLLRSNTGYEDGNYSVIAGHLDAEETIKQGIIREAQEEAGITVNHNDLKLVHIMHRKCPDTDRMAFFFTCDKWENEIINNEPDKCAELKWFNLENLPGNMVEYVREALTKYSASEIYSDYGF